VSAATAPSALVEATLAPPAINPARLDRTDVCIAVLTAAAALVFVTIGMGRPIWADDADTVRMAGQGFAGLFDALRHDNNFPAYHVLLSLWMRVFGDSEPALRSLAALFYLGAGSAVFALAWTVYHHFRTALFAALLFVGSAQAIAQAQSVRMYSMLAFLAAVSLLLFVRLFLKGEQSLQLCCAYLAVNSIGALTQAWFAFVLLGQFIALCGVGRGLTTRIKQFLACTAVPALAFGLLWAPTFREQIRNGSTNWLPAFQWWFLPDALLQFYGGSILAILLLLACAIPLLRAGAAERSVFANNRGTRALFAAFAVTLIAPLIVSMVKPIYYPGRYSIIALPPLAALLGAGLARFAARPYAAVLGVLLLLSTAIWQIQYRREPDRQDDRNTASYIAQHAAPGDAVVFTSLTRTSADYYFRRLRAPTAFRETSFPAELDQHPGWRDNAAMLGNPDALDVEAVNLTGQLASAAAHGRRIWMYYGSDQPVANFLKRRLDANLALESKLDLPGRFHETVLVYGARSLP